MESNTQSVICHNYYMRRRTRIFIKLLGQNEIWGSFYSTWNIVFSTGMLMWAFCGCQIKNTCMILMKIKAVILVCWLFYYTYTSYRLQYYIIPQHANFINGHNTSLTVAPLLNSASLCSTRVSIVCNQSIFL